MNLKGAAANKSNSIFRTNAGYPRSGPCVQRPFKFIIIDDKDPGTKHVWDEAKMALRAANQLMETELWMPIQNSILALLPLILPDPIEIPVDGYKPPRGKKGSGKK